MLETVAFVSEIRPDRIGGKVIELLVEHGCALMRQRRAAVTLFALLHPAAVGGATSDHF
jgi:hypothetical protein